MKFSIEYDLEDAGLEPEDLEIIADALRDSPMYVRNKDRKIVATIRQVMIKNHSLVLTLHFTDQYLEKNIDNERLIGKLYTILDPVMCHLQLAN